MLNTSLILGNGEVGKSLYNVLKKKYDVFIRDKENDNENVFWTNIDVMHVCFPYSKDFVSEVKSYIDVYEPKYTVIHSTVPIGISNKCMAFHSPVRGMHPNMEKGLKTFIKYLAPKDNFLKKYFEDAGIKIKFAKRSEDTEALKIFDTTQYGLSIKAEKIIHKFCKDNNLDFNIIYTDANNTYNDGYIKLGIKNVIRPVLEHKEGKIGGHCVIPNCDLLKNQLTNFVKKEI